MAQNMAARQVLVVDPPSVLKFKGPNTAPQTVELKLFNPTSNLVLFKIKTTAPKRYCVRPNSGSVQPQACVQVSITFQHSTIEAENDRSKHKFMVQSIVIASEAQPEQHDSLWKETSPDRIGETRLKCVYDPSESASENGSSPSQQEGSITTSDTTDSFNAASGSKSASVSLHTSISGTPDSIASENQQLRTRISQLSDECARLRESDLRLRRTAIPAAPIHSSSNANATVMAERQSNVHVQTLITLLVIAIFLGIALGKFIL